MIADVLVQNTWREMKSRKSRSEKRYRAIIFISFCRGKLLLLYCVRPVGITITVFAHFQRNGCILDIWFGFLEVFVLQVLLLFTESKLCMFVLFFLNKWIIQKIILSMSLTSEGSHRRDPKIQFYRQRKRHTFRVRSCVNSKNNNKISFKKGTNFL